MKPSVLVIGFGNPGRLDDGLGPALAEAIAARGIEGVNVESPYQLQIEHAARVSEHDVVVFADASLDGRAPFELRPVDPRPGFAFSTHSIEAETVLALARDALGGSTRGFVLAIRGYEFDEFGERLSPTARANLDAAAELLERLLRKGALAEEPVPSGEKR